MGRAGLQGVGAGSQGARGAQPIIKAPSRREGRRLTGFGARLQRVGIASLQGNWASPVARMHTSARARCPGAAARQPRPRTAPATVLKWFERVQTGFKRARLNRQEAGEPQGAPGTGQVAGPRRRQGAAAARTRGGEGPQLPPWQAPGSRLLRRRGAPAPRLLLACASTARAAPPTSPPAAGAAARAARRGALAPTTRGGPRPHPQRRPQPHATL
jgi:hypothetical protein